MNCTDLGKIFVKILSFDRKILNINLIAFRENTPEAF